MEERIENRPMTSLIAGRDKPNTMQWSGRLQVVSRGGSRVGNQIPSSYKARMISSFFDPNINTQQGTTNTTRLGLLAGYADKTTKQSARICQSRIAPPTGTSTNCRFQAATQEKHYQ